MNTLTKQTPSKLDPFEEVLFAMDAAKNTLAEMKQWLSGQGVTISFQAISQFLASRRKRRWQADILRQIASGQQPFKQAKTAFQNDPEPDLETLIKLSRVLIFEHAVHLKPGLMSSPTTNMVLNYINRQGRIESKNSQVALAERKLAIREASARENTLNQTRKKPDAGELLRAAFAALQAEQEKQPA